VEPDYLPDSEVLAFIPPAGGSGGKRAPVFIPHEVFTPQKYVHSSTLGGVQISLGGYP
jgi:hypothetical protein